MTWIIAILLSCAHARTSWRALGDADAVAATKRFLRGRTPVAIVTGPGANGFAHRILTSSTNLIVPTDSPLWFEAVPPELLVEGRTNVVVQVLDRRTNQDTLMQALERYQAQLFKIRLLLVVEDPTVRIEWSLRRGARLIELEPGCAAELGTRYLGWYQLDLFR